MFSPSPCSITGVVEGHFYKARINCSLMTCVVSKIYNLRITCFIASLNKKQTNKKKWMTEDIFRDEHTYRTQSWLAPTLGSTRKTLGKEWLSWCTGGTSEWQSSQSSSSGGNEPSSPCILLWKREQRLLWKHRRSNYYYYYTYCQLYLAF